MDNNPKMLEHNQTTYSQLRSYIIKHQNCCVVNPCGSGKSSIIAEIIKEFSDMGILVITKQANAEKYYYDKCPIFEEKNIPVITYTKLHNLYKEDRLKNLKNIHLCIFDEAHYIGANNWYNSVNELLKVTEATAIGVTATPQRFSDQGTDRSIVDFFSGNSVGNYSTKDLQRKGVFIEPEYIITLASLDTEINKRIDKINSIEEFSAIEKERYIGRLMDIQKAWEEKECPKVVMSKVIGKYLYREKGNKILVFSKDVASITTDEKYITNILKSIYPKKTIGTFEYTYQSSEDILQEFLENDTNDINILFSVNKICETIHIPDLNILIFLRSSYSNRIITQQAGRVNDINNPYKSVILDMVDNLSKFGKINNLGTLMDIESDIEKEQSENETRVNINLKYMSGSIRLFNQIDSLTQKYKTYMYNGISGTIPQLCDIFRKDSGRVNQLIKDENIEPLDALDVIPTKRKHTNNMLNNDNLLDLQSMDYVLSENDNKLIEKYYTAVADIAAGKNCTDEDIIGNCYVYLCHIVHKYNTENINTNESAYIRSAIATFIARSLRAKFDRLDMFEETENDYLYTSGDEMIKRLYTEEIGKSIDENVDTLSQKEQAVIILRFGLYGYKECSLDYVGRVLGVTRERVRQIESKAIRKLRNPVRLRKLSDYNIDELLQLDRDKNVEYVDELIRQAEEQYGDIDAVIAEEKAIEKSNHEANKEIFENETAKYMTTDQVYKLTKDNPDICRYLTQYHKFRNIDTMDELTRLTKNVVVIAEQKYIKSCPSTFASTIARIISEKPNPFWSHHELFRALSDEQLLHPYVRNLLTTNGLLAPINLVPYSNKELSDLFTADIHKYVAKYYALDRPLTDDENWFLKNYGNILTIIDENMSKIETIRTSVIHTLTDNDIAIVS